MVSSKLLREHRYEKLHRYEDALNAFAYTMLLASKISSSCFLLRWHHANVSRGLESRWITYCKFPSHLWLQVTSSLLAYAAAHPAL